MLLANNVMPSHSTTWRLIRFSFIPSQTNVFSSALGLPTLNFWPEWAWVPSLIALETGDHQNGGCETDATAHPRHPAAYDRGVVNGLPEEGWQLDCSRSWWLRARLQKPMLDFCTGAETIESIIYDHSLWPLLLGRYPPVFRIRHGQKEWESFFLWFGRIIWPSKTLLLIRTPESDLGILSIVQTPRSDTPVRHFFVVYRARGTLREGTTSVSSPPIWEWQSQYWEWIFSSFRYIWKRSCDKQHEKPGLRDAWNLFVSGQRQWS